MGATAIVGANWGDEGKGKMTDYLAAQSHFVVRYQGGSNAGHTIINDYGKFALHLLPSGVFHPHVINVISTGVAMDIEVFFKELELLSERGVAKPQLYVSERAQIVLPLHRLLDELEEERLGEHRYGSTRRGISPFYTDKYAKLGIQASDLLHEPTLKRKLEQLLAQKNVLLQHLYGKSPLEAEQLLSQLMAQGEKLRPYLRDTTILLHEAVAEGKSILLEGQLGALRDVDHGIYPYTTSTSTLAGFATVGANLPPRALTTIIAVVKAYSSCVGAGPFVTELFGAEAEELRQRGGDAGEYGATTGRPRRVGWFDAVATRYGCMLQGATTIALTNLDVLGYLDDIPVCVAYELEDGTFTTNFPVNIQLEGAKPVIQHLSGWKCDISHIRTFAELPSEAQQYVRFIEQATGISAGYISVGPERSQLIMT